MIHSVIKVGIICPLDIEYKIGKEILKLHNATELAGRVISTRREKDIEAFAIKAGVGKINCSSATQLIIDQFHPDFIIDAGVTGSLTETLKIFDIVCGEYSFEYDACTGKKLGKTPPDDDKSFTVLSKPPCKKVFQEFSSWVRETMGMTIQFGIIACGEKDVKNTGFKQKLRRELNAITCNWETSAVLKTAQINGVKSFSFRVIVDFADENMNDYFDKNCGPALKKMFPVLREFIFNGWIHQFY